MAKQENKDLEIFGTSFSLDFKPVVESFGKMFGGSIAGIIIMTVKIAKLLKEEDPEKFYQLAEKVK